MNQATIISRYQKKKKRKKEGQPDIMCLLMEAHNIAYEEFLQNKAKKNLSKFRPLVFTTSLPEIQGTNMLNEQIQQNQGCGWETVQNKLPAFFHE